MKRWIARCLVMATMLGMASILGASCNSLGGRPVPRVAGPRLQVLEPEARYEVEEGDVVVHVFRIRNAGSEPLVVNDVKCSACEVRSPRGQVLRVGPPGMMTR